MDGLVEVCMKKKWEKVCNQVFNEPTADVICKQLGFYKAGISQ